MCLVLKLVRGMLTYVLRANLPRKKILYPTDLQSREQRVAIKRTVFIIPSSFHGIKIVFTSNDDVQR